MDLKKAPEGGIDVVSLGDCCVEDLDRVLAPFHVDNFCTKKECKKRTNTERDKRVLVVKLAKFLCVECSTHDHNLKRVQT